MTKGREREQDAAACWQDAGYETYIPPKAKYREQDVFGLYDVLAYKPSESGLVGIQVRSRAAGITEWYEQARQYWGPIFPQYMVYHDDEDAWRLSLPKRDEGYEWVVDERDMDVEMGEGVVEYLAGDSSR